jgi:hypothetical protein
VSGPPHHGTAAQQIEAVECLGRENDARLDRLERRVEELRAALCALLGGQEPAAGTWGAPAGYPPSARQMRRHGLRLVRPA